MEEYCATWTKNNFGQMKEIHSREKSMCGFHKQHKYDCGAKFRRVVKCPRYWLLLRTCQIHNASTTLGANRAESVTSGRPKILLQSQKTRGRRASTMTKDLRHFNTRQAPAAPQSHLIGQTARLLVRHGTRHMKCQRTLNAAQN